MRGIGEQARGSDCGSLLRPVVSMIVGDWNGGTLGFDGAHLRKELNGFSGLALSTQDLRKLIVRTTVMIMREIAPQNLFSSGIVLLGCVGLAQLLVRRPEIGLAANCQLEMRNCLCCSIFRDKNGAYLPA